MRYLFESFEGRISDKAIVHVRPSTSCGFASVKTGLEETSLPTEPSRFVSFLLCAVINLKIYLILFVGCAVSRKSLARNGL